LAVGGPSSDEPAKCQTIDDDAPGSFAGQCHERPRSSALPWLRTLLKYARSHYRVVLAHFARCPHLAAIRALVGVTVLAGVTGLDERNGVG
jgi:hypothetical protein